MAKILLIHGYGTGNPTLKSEARKYYQFLGFKPYIDKKEAVVFEWFKGSDYLKFNFLNPFDHFFIYRKEKLLALDEHTFKNLKQTLITQKTQIIICHSMGSYLLLNYLHKNELPKNVKRIIFIQADLSKNFDLPNEVEVRLNKGSLIWENYYCPWDITLIFSMFINFYLPAGLFGASEQLIKNYFYPLHSYILLHISSIRSEKFITKMLNRS